MKLRLSRRWALLALVAHSILVARARSAALLPVTSRLDGSQRPSSRSTRLLSMPGSGGLRPGAVRLRVPGRDLRAAPAADRRCLDVMRSRQHVDDPRRAAGARIRNRARAGGCTATSPRRPRGDHRPTDRAGQTERPALPRRRDEDGIDWLRHRFAVVAQRFLRCRPLAVRRRARGHLRNGRARRTTETGVFAGRSPMRRPAARTLGPGTVYGRLLHRERGRADYEVTAGRPGSSARPASPSRT